MKVKSKGIEVGTFSGVTADFVVDVGAGDLPVRMTVRLGGAGTKRVYQIPRCIADPIEH
jgi:hypothetical protein